MKKLGFLVPFALILISTIVAPRLLAGGSSPKSLIFIGLGMVLLVMMVRPKKAATKTAMQLEHEIMDDFSKDAFAGNDVLGNKFMKALGEAGNNMPKSAAVKLQKLAAECTTDPQKYAVAMASAHVYRMSQDWKNVIREYNKAIVLHPTADLAYKIGDCNQRLGRLDKARDSYEFAMELDPSNPQFVSSLGTICVSEGDYDAAIDYALDALALDPNFSQALATLAICHGVRRNTEMYDKYSRLAIENGYSSEKIATTVKALRKR